MISPQQLQDRIDTYTLTTAEDERRTHLGASEIGGKCLRKTYYDFRWCGREIFDAKSLRIFDRGDREEPVVVARLRGAKFIVESSCEAKTDEEKAPFRFKDLSGHFAGTVDGVLLDTLDPNAEWMLLEIKTSKAETKQQPSPGFETLVKQGVKSAAPRHFSQMTVYMGQLGFKRALYYAVNKNNEDYYTEIVEFDPQHFEECLNKAEAVVTAETPPERYSNDRKSHTCLYCIHNKICHEKQPVSESNRHCRNCVYGAPAAGGTWDCLKGHTFGNVCADYTSV